MEFYGAPDCLETGGVCPPVPVFDGLGLPVGMQLPLQTAPVAAAEADLADEMELLERIMRECNLCDPAGPSAPEPMAVAAPRAAVATQVHVAGAPTGVLAAAQPAEAAVAPQAMFGHSATSSLAPWAEEMVQRLQGCSSTAEASARCAEMLATFQQRAAGDPQRMRRLQSANSVLMRALRSLNQRHREQLAQRQRAEEANKELAAELERCQEALRASERARGQLQYHLQVMGRSSGTAAGGM